MNIENTDLFSGHGNVRKEFNFLWNICCKIELLGEKETKIKVKGNFQEQSQEKSHFQFNLSSICCRGYSPQNEFCDHFLYIGSGH